MKVTRIRNQDLSLSFDRFLRDAYDDFFPDPIRYKDLSYIKDEILEQVQRDLTKALQGSRVAYATYAFCDWDVPKSNYVVRHAVCLHPVDRIVYSFILQKLGPSIEKNLSEARYSYRPKNFNSKRLFGKRIVDQWIRFRTNLKKYIKEHAEFKYVVSTDIAGFYEYVHITDFKKQMYNLCNAKNDRLIELLTVFLRSCAPSNHSGIPQNYDPSSYLASAFLDFLDKDLEAGGWKHFRYVDDIKVACKTKRDAQLAIIELIRSLRRFNLNLATHKTEIWDTKGPDYRDFIREFPVVLSNTDKAVARKNRRLVNGCLKQLISDVKPMTRKGSSSFDERLFRAYIWRIVKCLWFKDVERVDLTSVAKACLRLLEEMPERTDTFTRFLSLYKERKYVQEAVCRIIDTCVYPWQEMHLWSLMTEADKMKADALFSLARRRLRDTSYPEAARAYATVFLGKHGNYQDRNSIALMLRTPSSFFTVRATLLALQEHPDKRSIYKRYLQSSSDPAITGLVRYLLQSSEIEYIHYDRRISGEMDFLS